MLKFIALKHTNPIITEMATNVNANSFFLKLPVSKKKTEKSGQIGLTSKIKVF